MSGPGRRSHVRPARPLSVIPLSVMILLVWWVVAHNSGSGWVQVLGDSVFGMLLVGLLAPGVVLARVRVHLVTAPVDGVCDTPLLLELQSSSRVRVTPIEPPGPVCFTGRRSDGVDDQVALLPRRRGVHDEIVVTLSTAAPFGLQWWSRRINFHLTEPLHIAPRLGHPIRIPTWVDERFGPLGRELPTEAGDARGIRDYRPGDRRSRVHWVASAHAGRLMVREMERPSTQPITLRVSLPVEPDAADRVAECALGTVVNLLDRGVPLLLATHESTGIITGPIGQRREAGRRLARATPGPGTPGLDLVP